MSLKKKAKLDKELVDYPPLMSTNEVLVPEEERKASRTHSRRLSFFESVEGDNLQTDRKRVSRRGTNITKSQETLYEPPPKNFIVLMYGGFETKLVNMNCKRGIFIDFLVKTANINPGLLVKTANIYPGCEVDLCDTKGCLVGLNAVEINESVQPLLTPTTTYIPVVILKNEFGHIVAINPCLDERWPEEEPGLKVGLDAWLGAQKDDDVQSILSIQRKEAPEKEKRKADSPKKVVEKKKK